MIIILMGVSGSGKTTLGKLLAEKLGYHFYDADDFHSPGNKLKMEKGIALTDEERQPWLQTLAGEMKKWNQENPATLLACSALKQKYRDLLSKNIPVRWVYLKGDRETIRQRLENRAGHFVKKDLLESQFEALEEPKEAIILDINQDLDRMVESLVLELR